MKNHLPSKPAWFGAMALLATVVSLHAQSGSWTNLQSSVWSDATNWLNGVIATNAGNTATFSADLSTNDPANVTITVSLDPSVDFGGRTIGNLTFADTDTATPGSLGNWLINDGGLGLFLDNPAETNVYITVNTATGAANNLAAGWENTTLSANLNSADTVVKAGPGHLILNPSVGNSFASAFVISNGMVQLGIGANPLPVNANPIAMGAAPVIFRGGSVRLQNASIPGSNPSATPTEGTFPNAMVVEAGQTGTLYLSPRAFPAFSGPLTGSGTLNLVVDFVRGNLGGDWSAFTGSINVSAAPRQNSDFRLTDAFSVPGLPSARLHFTTNGVNANQVFWYNNGTADTVFAIGELSADVPNIVNLFANSTTAAAGNSLRFVIRVGGLNTDASFSGNFTAPGTANGVGIIKEGTGNWTLNGQTIEYNGITVISNGVLQIGSGTSGKLGRSAVVSNYSAIAFGRTDTALAVTNIIDGPGILIQRGSGRTTLSPSGGANTYTGKTFVTNGTLAIAGQAALGAAPVGYVADQLALNGGSLAATTSVLIDGSTRGITLGVNGGGVGADGANTLTIGNIIAGAGNLIINNSGTVAPTVVNSFSGKTILQSGTLLLNSETPLGAAPGVATADQITFDGGTLQASATFAIDDANRGITFNAGGGTISPDAAVTLTLSEPTAGTGSLTKTGAGTLVLNGVGSHTGSTLITQGTLAIGASGTSASAVISVGAGATFNVSATSFTVGSGQTLTGNGSVVGNVVAGSGSTISAGTSVGILNFANNLSLSGGATNLVEISSATNDLVNVTGDLSLSGVNTILLSPLSSLPPGTYTLIKYGGNLTAGGVANLVLAGYPVSRISASLVHNAGNKSIDLVLAGGAVSMVWQGGLNGNAWDVVTTTNWLNGGTPDAFFNGDSVTFNDVGAANNSVNLSMVVQPASVTVNSATDYTFSGNGRISGLADLTKSGANTLNVLTTNDSTGLTTINSGTVRVGNGSSSGSLGGGNIVNNAALAFNLPDTRNVAGQISGTGGLTVQAGKVVLTGNNSYSGSTVINNGASVEVGDGGASGSLGTGPVTDNGSLAFLRTGTVTNTGAISGAGSLTVQSGTVALAANNSYAGTTTVDAGTLQVGIGGVSGTLGTAGVVTATNGGTIAFNRADNLTNAVTIVGVNGSVAQFGPGTLVITNESNDYGTTLITGGRLQIGDGVNASGRLGRGTVTVTSPGALVINRPDVFALTNVITGSGSVVAASPTNVNITTLGTANTYSGGTTISNSYVELVPQTTSPAATGVQLVNNTGLGTGTVTFQGNSSLQLAWATTQDPDTLGAGNFANPINVPAGQTATIWLPGRFEMSGPLSGSGTLNLGVNYVRGNYSGNWSNFFGTLNIVSNSIYTGANQARDFRPFNTNGFPNAKLHLGLSTAMYWRGTANAVVPIGELSGEENSFINGAGGAEGGNSVTWRVGGLGTSSTYGGTIGGTVFVGLIKEGAGTLTLTGPNNYLGMTTISNGVLALATSSLGANGEIFGSTNIAIVAPASLNVLQRTDATFQLGSSAAQVLAGNGTLVGNLAVNGLGTLAPGFSIGTLAVSGNVSFPGGGYLVEINPAAAQTSDRVTAQNVDLNGVIITVTNLGSTLKTGDSFQIFQASGLISGTPTSVTGALPPGPGAAWDISNLTVNGTITAILPPSPTLTNSVSGGGTTLDFAWDAGYLGWRLYAQTNTLGVGISTNWVPVEGTEFTTTYSAPIDRAGVGAVFYRLAYP